jgi:hypothetical protein
MRSRKRFTRLLIACIQSFAIGLLVLAAAGFLYDSSGLWNWYTTEGVQRILTALGMPDALKTDWFGHIQRDEVTIQAAAELYFAPAILAAIGWFHRAFFAIPRDGRTRCADCGHILSGLSRPVCPECGAGI